MTRLFNEHEPLALRMNLSFKDIKKNTNDSTFIPSVLYYQVGEKWDSIKISVRSRGFFRKANCFFTPLHIKIKKEHAKGTLFEGNKSLKLVLPCETSKNNNSLLMKEYICYKMYEHITPYVFNTRLVNIDLSEGTGGKTKKYQITAFFIEDDDLVAKRHHAKVVEDEKIHPLALQDTSAARYYLFQYLIANTDWSTTLSHNTKTIKIEPRKLIPLAYDFDMAGFVDAPYATTTEELNLTSVRERLYRGFCPRNETAVRYVRQQFIDSEPQLRKEITNYENSFDPKEVIKMNKFLDEFFKILKNDSEFQTKIINGCRKN